MTTKNSRIEFKSAVKSEYSYLENKTRQSVFSIIGTYFTLYFINQIYGNAYNLYNKPANTESLNKLFKEELTTITNVLKNPQFRGEFFSQSLINMQEQLRSEPHLSTISFQIFVDMIFKEICPPDYEKAVRMCDKTTMIISAIYNSFMIFMKLISKNYIDMIVFKRDDPYTLEVLRDAYNRSLEQASNEIYEKIVNPTPASIPIINKSIKKELNTLVSNLDNATTLIKKQQEIIENSRKLISAKNTEITNLRSTIESKHNQVLSQSIEISNLKNSLNIQLRQNQDLVRSLELLKTKNQELIKSPPLTKENLMNYDETEISINNSLDEDIPEQEDQDNFFNNNAIINDPNPHLDEDLGEDLNENFGEDLNENFGEDTLESDFNIISDLNTNMATNDEILEDNLETDVSDQMPDLVTETNDQAADQAADQADEISVESDIEY